MEGKTKTIPTGAGGHSPREDMGAASHALNAVFLEITGRRLRDRKEEEE